MVRQHNGHSNNWKMSWLEQCRSGPRTCVRIKISNFFTRGRTWSRKKTTNSYFYQPRNYGRIKISIFFTRGRTQSQKKTTNSYVYQPMNYGRIKISNFFTRVRTLSCKKLRIPTFISGGIMVLF